MKTTKQAWPKFVAEANKYLKKCTKKEWDAAEALAKSLSPEIAKSVKAVRKKLKRK